jgi:hypothetical protein
MATAHVVYITLTRIGPTGKLLVEGDTIGTRLNFSTEHRIIPKVTVPNSSNNPTIDQYIEAEAVDGFILQHLSEYIIVTIKP